MPSEPAEVLALLLKDPGLRAELRRDPRRTLTSLGADPELDLNPEDLELQARTLVDKRFHEVAKLLPATLHTLGGEAGRIFGEHAAVYWPEGHRRHERDAEAFLVFLEARGLRFSRAEARRVRFLLGDRRWSLGFVPDARVRGGTHAALQLLYRRRGSVRSLAFYLGF